MSARSCRRERIVTAAFVPLPSHIIGYFREELHLSNFSFVNNYYIGFFCLDIIFIRLSTFYCSSIALILHHFLYSLFVIDYVYSFLLL